MPRYYRQSNGFINYIRKHLRLTGRRISILFRRLVEKGNEKVTIMLIPHSENRIFHFKIKALTITLIWLVITGVVFYGLYSIEENDYLLISKSELKDQNSNQLENLFKFINSVRPLQREFNLLQENIEKLKTLSKMGSAGQPSGQSLTSLAYRYEKENILDQQYSSEEDDSMDELVQLNKLSRNMKNLDNTVNGMVSQLQKYKRLLHIIPSLYPLSGSGYIISSFGPRLDPFTYKSSWHNGVHIAAAPGSNVLVTSDGVVSNSGWSNDKGLYVVVNHGYGFSTLYGHLQEIKLNQGDKVKRGQLIGLSGNTGRTLGAGLYYEIRINNQPVDPLTYINLKK